VEKRANRRKSCRCDEQPEHHCPNAPCETKKHEYQRRDYQEVHCAAAIIVRRMLMTLWPD
jgi:hypothetical protein